MKMDQEGMIALSIGISVSSREMSQWPVGCITEFFGGVARAQEAAAAAREILRQQSQPKVQAP